MRTATITIDIYGFPMECEHEFEEGGESTYSALHGWEPGWAASATLLTCVVGGVNVYEMLTDKQIERIEAAILAEVEFA